MENKKINEDLNMEREKVEINKNYISYLILRFIDI